MRPVIHTFLYDDNGNRFFGEGPYQLLIGVGQTGSLRQAAAQMGMAYTKALAILRRAESALGCPLIERQTGGRGGGGSCLTDNAKELITRYTRYKKECSEAAQRIFEECFPDKPFMHML